ncbi:hypothetical protein B5V89_15255 [Heyndrickxia sporothermodurans]|uniref:hypothetical protein n=1 Tax=Heyndrickxia sporothermodurans TaxID=46224 RepID=UPI000D33702E|nr:hypothetical protein [Heyndrickxia sporothermodurans]PTY77233.1 hypothetical protein B5V89_15255 [Heyndrickxia sporothermodurans]
MEVLEKGMMLDGTLIQIEEWSTDYSFMPYGSTLASYPKSKQTLDGSFSPNRNERFRFELTFKSYEDTKKAFDKLINGEKQLNDYENNFKGKKEYLECI